MSVNLSASNREELTRISKRSYDGFVMASEAGENPARSRHCNRKSSSTAYPEVRPRHDLERSLPKGRASQGVVSMSDIPFAREVRPIPVPIGELLPWAVFGGLILVLAIYFVGAEQGATSLISGMYIHEFVHDGRHLLGFPCH
jgi:hypothetical protein